MIQLYTLFCVSAQVRRFDARARATTTWLPVEVKSANRILPHAFCQ